MTEPGGPGGSPDPGERSKTGGRRMAAGRGPGPEITRRGGRAAPKPQKPAPVRGAGFWGAVAQKGRGPQAPAARIPFLRRPGGPGARGRGAPPCGARGPSPALRSPSDIGPGGGSRSVPELGPAERSAMRGAGVRGAAKAPRERSGAKRRGAIAGGGLFAAGGERARQGERFPRSPRPAAPEGLRGPEAGAEGVKKAPSFRMELSGTTDTLEGGAHRARLPASDFHSTTDPAVCQAPFAAGARRPPRGGAQ